MSLVCTISEIEDHIAELTSQPAENALGIVSRSADQIDLGDIAIEQSISLLYQHSTGAVVWHTTPKFANWIRYSPLSQLVKGKTVVELGSGTGALALLLHEFYGKFIATDQKPLLKLLQRNCGDLSNVEIKELDWETQEFLGTEDEGIVVACDTIYNEYLLKPFTEAVQSVWKSSPHITHAIICVQLRDLHVVEQALQLFIEAFKEVRYFEIAPGYAAYLVEQTN